MLAQEEEEIHAPRRRDDVPAPAYFLNNHPPPPANSMPTTTPPPPPPPPEHEDDVQVRGRFSKSKSIRSSSKSLPSKSRHIWLPDSAVAGVTLAGHRHIAISIPLEATPFGQDARSQYPVLSHDLQMGTPSKAPVRTFTNDKGVVTVLRPLVSQEHGTNMPTTASKQRLPSSAVPLNQKPLPLPPRDPTANFGRQPVDYIGVLPMAFDTSLLDDCNVPWNIPSSQSGDKASTHDRPSPPPPQKPAAPARVSSTKINHIATAAKSLDGMMLVPHQAKHMPSVARGRHLSGSTGPGKSVAATLDKGGKDESRDEQPKSTSGPLYDGAPPALSRKGSSISGANSATQAGPPLAEEAHSRPSKTPSLARSRKEIVREKRRRDLEAMLRAKTKEQHDDRLATPGAAQQHSATGFSSWASRPPTPTPTTALTMSSLMVVMDVEPCPEDEVDASQRPKSPPCQDTAMHRPKSPGSLPDLNDPNMPTPPTSAHGSPRQQRRSSSSSSSSNNNNRDRTLLTRPQESNGNEERERKVRNVIAMAKAKATARRLALGSATCQDGAVSQADMEAKPRYEAHEEHRLWDMEHRLRRLERNGDIWLEALVPVLNSMSSAMMATKDRPPEAVGDVVSGEETFGDASWIKGELERMAGKRYDDGAPSDCLSRGDDTSGLRSIEPLMRELAGGPRRWKSTVVTSGKS
ncbi:hypothetical protein UVI_02032910 [Ustilaginoidea virens]|uniref:Uncharacterized protein n=1 Tax=Ustilaginoidea virens TaxID=1159556 RepID=A0A1B5L599_USTVR|nr:hypothetical protein UVI_02032910 [Ustilaginoidea virens]